MLTFRMPQLHVLKYTLTYVFPSLLFTSLEEDLFALVGLYMNTDQIPIIFDYRYSVSVSPIKEDFGDTSTMIGDTKQYKV